MRNEKMPNDLFQGINLKIKWRNRKFHHLFIMNMGGHFPITQKKKWWSISHQNQSIQHNMHSHTDNLHKLIAWLCFDPNKTNPITKPLTLNQKQFNHTTHSLSLSFHFYHILKYKKILPIFCFNPQQIQHFLPF